MRALLIGLFVGYFLTACAPVFWSGAHLVGTLVVAVVALVIFNRVRLRGGCPAVVFSCAQFACGVTAATLILGAALVRVQVPDASLLRCIDNKVLVRVRIVGVPRGGADGSRFNAKVLDVARRQANCAGLRGATLRMTWREASQILPGQVLLAEIRLRQLRGIASPGAFDQELHAVRHGVLLRGFVVRALALRDARSYQQFFATQRFLVGAAIQRGQFTHAGVLLALLTGDTRLLAPTTWQLLQDSGTVHLLVISGLHVGLVTALLFGLVRLLVRSFSLLFPAAGTGSLSQALLTCGLGLLYVLFVGAAVPAVRAWIMASLVLIAWSLQRRIDPAMVLCVAAVLVVLVDGLAPLAPGFWLSFGLVGWLLLGQSSGPPGPSNTVALGQVSWLWRRWVLPVLKLHLGCSIILAPLLGWSGLPVAGVGPLANAMAVPFVSLLLVPCLLVGLVVQLLSPPAAVPVLAIADGLVGWLLAGLEWLVQVLPAISLPVDSPLLLCGLLTLVIATLIPAPGRARLAAAAALLLWAAPLPAPILGWTKVEWGVRPDGHVSPNEMLVGEFILHVLDVGQGLAVLVHTRDTTVVYDTGASYPGGFNFADAVIVPALLRWGQGNPGWLIVSHPDHDHAGGYAAFHRQYPAVPVVLSDTAAPCQWPVADVGEKPLLVSAGVTFELLQDRSSASTNNRSCVLVVRGKQRVAVLAGDIEARAEAALLPQLPGQIDMLLVPHHGSRTSSTAGFVNSLRPGIAVVSAGHGNRFGHPHPEVVARYERAGSELVTTAQSGSLLWRSTAPLQWQGYRQLRSQRWRLGAPLIARLPSSQASE